VDNDKHVGLSEATVRPHPTKTLNEGGTSQLDEFMRVMKPRTKKGASWANEDASSEVALPVTSSSAFTPSMTHTSVVARERNTEKKSKAPEELTSEESANVMQTDGTPQEGMSDLDWMKKRMSQAMDLNANEERVFEQSDDDATVVDSNEVSPRFLTNSLI
jgi:multiple RNA-binding domain-containing protein 1